MENTLHHSLSRFSQFLTNGPIRRRIDRALCRILIETLRCGPIPEHIAFVMDGNRRFARKRGQQNAFGHHLGFDCLKQILEVCLRLGVKVVTVYAFSIENFKRSKSEVDTLMQLAKDRLMELCEHGEFLGQYGIRIRVIGRTSMIPPDVKTVIDDVTRLTRDNTGATLNICFPYTSRDEMTTAARTFVHDCVEGRFDVQKATVLDYDNRLMTSHQPPVDVVVRTSGVRRLSDFLLWQSHQACRIHFVDCYWPEFSIWNLMPILVDYQVNYKILKAERQKLRKYDRE